VAFGRFELFAGMNRIEPFKFDRSSLKNRHVNYFFTDRPAGDGMGERLNSMAPQIKYPLGSSMNSKKLQATPMGNGIANAK
jgi:hypothetical protein